jgi:uncharacterized iron-regulated protein
MKKPVVVILIIFFSLTGFDRHRPAYKLYNESGREVTYRKMIRTFEDADIILLGELHDNPIAHWLRYEVVGELFARSNGRMVLAAEMFESDNQLILDEYMKNLITERVFEDEAKLWRNYKTDYKPLIDFARENSLPVVASNIPRRYANMVFHGGFQALDEIDNDAKRYIAPLPVDYNPDLPGYQSMTKMGNAGHAGENLPKAQAIKDATMAHFILENWSPGKLLIHFHGSYHSDNFEGIYWYLKQKNPDLKIVTLSTTLQQDTGELDEESYGRGDFILVVPESMTRTY